MEVGFDLVDRVDFIKQLIKDGVDASTPIPIVSPNRLRLYTIDGGSKYDYGLDEKLFDRTLADKWLLKTLTNELTEDGHHVTLIIDHGREREYEIGLMIDKKYVVGIPSFSCCGVYEANVKRINFDTMLNNIKEASGNLEMMRTVSTVDHANTILTFDGIAMMNRGLIDQKTLIEFGLVDLIYTESLHKMAGCTAKPRQLAAELYLSKLYESI